MKIKLIEPTLGHAKGKELNVSKPRAFYMMRDGHAKIDKKFMAEFTNEFIYPAKNKKNKRKKEIKKNS